MNTQATNLFIVDKDKTMVNGLVKYLNAKFDSLLNITEFYDGESCLENIKKNTNIVILAYDLNDINGINGIETLRAIKKINPKTEVIMYTSNQNISIAIEAYRRGASDVIIKGKNSRRKLADDLYYLITYPYRVLVEEFKVSKFLVIIFMSCALIGIVVAASLLIVNNT